MFREINQKFKLGFYLLLTRTKDLVKLENVRQGECDFCTKSAKNGVKLENDAFYGCETHKF